MNNVCDSQGRCSCKRNVDSDYLKCTHCLDGYWNLTQSNLNGCESKYVVCTGWINRLIITFFIVCDCAVEGTEISDDLPLCDKVTGDCICTESAQGRQCDQCKVLSE